MTKWSSALILGLHVAVCAAVVAAADRPIELKSLAGDWRSVGRVNPAEIHINEDGSYEGIAATGAKTSGRITITDGKASYKSTTSEGTVSLSTEGGKDVLTFMPKGGRGSPKLERVR
jgi:hypothetical protein